ncbi:hypothetical protein L1987_47040 [Smallanthus sonchifolius]|uniref:Uncharacterized protein n=1 Tax=Smallanthus sonchifolius TaxID=185202 RepID=A0ACB9G1A0_9ASTR|nr:hypothetical protein L1987_47040 [Smallanthus sonchifolius]
MLLNATAPLLTLPLHLSLSLSVLKPTSLCTLSRRCYLHMDSNSLITTTSSAVVTGDHTPSTTTITRTLRLIQDDSHDPFSKIQAAKEIRRLTKTSQRCRRQFSDAIPSLVSMLRYPSLDAKAAALLALLNLAVQDETNKISIIGGEEQSGNAKQMLADMVQVSMEQSLRHLQRRALVKCCSVVGKPVQAFCVWWVSCDCYDGIELQPIQRDTVIPRTGH